ncbi:hypothetical protein AtDm6_3269 [Acetobacter tropicalis]|uniref:Uncharacterized protein n=1 Tax=Acetobacter tropicalis TaxID=104102 RepID=A0A095AW58_9PROT|nr:hypothetical protein AtDm6_3269 [Acetobacter tropicalis]
MWTAPPCKGLGKKMIGSLLPYVRPVDAAIGSLAKMASAA